MPRGDDWPHCAPFLRQAVELLYVTFGLAVGVGLGVSYTCGLITVGSYFEARRGAAMGLAVAGTGCGGIALPPLWTFLFEEYRFRGTLLILGAFMLHICFVGSLYRPIEDNYSRRRAEKTRKTKEHREEAARLRAAAERRPLIRRLGFDCGILKNLKFVIYILAFNLAAPAVISSWQMLPSLALTASASASAGAIDKSQAAFLVSLDSICDLVGRVGSGILTDFSFVRVS